MITGCNKPSCTITLIVCLDTFSPDAGILAKGTEAVADGAWRHPGDGTAILEHGLIASAD